MNLKIYKKKLSQSDQYKIDHLHGTIGEIEALAGISSDYESRCQFWSRFYKPHHDFVADGCIELRRMVADRVRSGELSLI